MENKILVRREQQMPPIPCRWEYVEPVDYMVGFIPDLTFENVVRWVAPDNLARHERREYEGFTLWASVDDDQIPGREVTLGRIAGVSDEGQHVHDQADSFVIVTAGEADLYMGEIVKHIAAPKLIRVPKGTPHGFKLVRPDQYFEFLTVQYPPIRNPQTGVEDFYKIQK